MPKIRIRFLIFFSIFLAFGASISSVAQPIKSFNQHLQKQWSIEDGLLQVVANVIVQDKAGYIWVGAQYGLTRFDGVSFKTFTQAESEFLGGYVNSLYADPNGALWIGTNKGLVLYKNDRFSLIYPKNNNDKKRAMLINVTGISQQDDGKIIVATTEGVFSVEENQLASKSEFPAIPAYSILTRNLEIIVGSVGAIHIYQKGHTERLTLPESLSHLKVDNLVWRKGILWAGTTQGLFQVTDNGIQKYLGNSFVADAPINAMMNDSQDILWIASYIGLFRIYPDNSVELVENNNPKAFKVILSFYEDAENNIWLGSYVNGIAKLKKAFADSYGIESGLSEPIVWSIADNQSKGTFIGTNNGLEVFKNNQFSRVISGEKLPHPVVYTQLVTPEGLIIGTRAGAAILNDNQLIVPESFKSMRQSHVRAILRLEA